MRSGRAVSYLVIGFKNYVALFYAKIEHLETGLTKDYGLGLTKIY